jgi:hypothetical protein
MNKNAFLKTAEMLNTKNLYNRIKFVKICSINLIRAAL